MAGGLALTEASALDRRSLLLGALVLPLSACVTGATAKRPAFRVATFNIWHDAGAWAARLPLLGKALREANAAKSRLIARHTGQTHAAVNAELNRISGVKKVSEATVQQLEKRLEKADAWLRQASARRVAG